MSDNPSNQIDDDLFTDLYSAEEDLDGAKNQPSQAMRRRDLLKILGGVGVGLLVGRGVLEAAEEVQEAKELEPALGKIKAVAEYFDQNKEVFERLKSKKPEEVVKILKEVNAHLAQAISALKEVKMSNLRVSPALVKPGEVALSSALSDLENIEIQRLHSSVEECLQEFLCRGLSRLSGKTDKGVELGEVPKNILNLGMGLVQDGFGVFGSAMESPKKALSEGLKKRGERLANAFSGERAQIKRALDPKINKVEQGYIEMSKALRRLEDNCLTVQSLISSITDPSLRYRSVNNWALEFAVRQKAGQK